jgi:hypothetical protein
MGIKAASSAWKPSYSFAFIRLFSEETVFGCTWVAKKKPMEQSSKKEFIIDIFQ